jgi:glyoxylase-like metal-dependent hydrolase (beta-lactamase superfamily II)
MASGTFSPVTATLVSGPTEAVLIDAQYLKDDVRDLGDLIERTGKKLTTIDVTHAHADHYLGIGPLMKRCPQAKCVALPHIVEFMKEHMEINRQ